MLRKRLKDVNTRKLSEPQLAGVKDFKLYTIRPQHKSYIQFPPLNTNLLTPTCLVVTT